MSRNPYISQHYGSSGFGNPIVNGVGVMEEFDASTGFSRFPHATHIKYSVFKSSRSVVQTASKSPVRTTPDSIFSLHCRNRLPFDDPPSRSATPLAGPLPLLSDSNGLTGHTRPTPWGAQNPNCTAETVTPVEEPDAHSENPAAEPFVSSEAPATVIDTGDGTLSSAALETSRSSPSLKVSAATVAAETSPIPETNDVTPTAPAPSVVTVPPIDTLLQRSKRVLLQAQTLLDEPAAPAPSEDAATAQLTPLQLIPRPQLVPAPAVPPHASSTAGGETKGGAVDVPPPSVADFGNRVSVQSADGGKVPLLLNSPTGSVGAAPPEEDTRQLTISLCAHPEWQAARRVRHRRAPSAQQRDLRKVALAETTLLQDVKDTNRRSKQRSRHTDDQLLSLSAFNSMLAQLGSFLQAGNSNTFGPGSPVAETFAKIRTNRVTQPSEVNHVAAAPNLGVARRAPPMGIPPPTVVFGREPRAMHVLRRAEGKQAPTSRRGYPSYSMPTKSWVRKNIVDSCKQQPSASADPHGS